MSGKSKKAKSGARWRTVRRKGGTFLKSPDGEYYAGTAAEVRRLGLSPIERDNLAGSLRVFRMVCATPDTFAERRQSAAEARRWAIMRDCVSRRSDRQRRNDEIITRAAARYMGQTVDEFERGAVLAFIEATIEEYNHDSGGWGLPLTRQERAAITCDIADYCNVIRKVRSAATA